MVLACMATSQLAMGTAIMLLVASALPEVIALALIFLSLNLQRSWIMQIHLTASSMMSVISNCLQLHHQASLRVIFSETTKVRLTIRTLKTLLMTKHHQRHIFQEPLLWGPLQFHLLLLKSIPTALKTLTQMFTAWHRPRSLVPPLLKSILRSLSAATSLSPRLVTATAPQSLSCNRTSLRFRA